MKAIALTANNDIDLSAPGGSWAEGQAVVAGYITAEMRTFRGEWFYDRDGGFDAIGLGRDRFSRAKLEAELRRCMSRVPGITRIDSLDVSYNGQTRRIDFTMGLVTPEGRVDLTGESTPNAGILATLYSGATIYQMSILP